MPTTSMLEWLSGIPDTLPQEAIPAPSRKRRRLNPATPDPSEGYSTKDERIASMSRRLSPSKHQMPTDDETPRPKRVQTPRSESNYSLSERSQVSLQSSKQSGQLSPQKQFQILKLNPKGIQFRDLTQFDDRPECLDTLLETVDVIMEGKGIVSISTRESLTKAAQSCKDFKWACRGDDYFSESRDAIGHTPSPEDVLLVMTAAAECSTNSHPEANWNLEVHQRLLELAFRPPGQGVYKHLVNFMGCTQASIIPEYCASTPPKKVDFCIYIDPSNNPPSPSSTISAQSAFERCRGELPGRVFNFTDFVPLDQRPIALSIETKKPSEGFDGAKLQLGVWQMAHWSFLRHLRYLAETSSKEDPTISALPLFIPGIIIQGHDWHLIITTLEEQKTFFWQKVLIGSTSSTKGIYQIIYVLHVLRRWVEDTYWPWLRDIVLRGWARPEITGNMVQPV